MADWPDGEVVRYDGNPNAIVEALPYYDDIPTDHPMENLLFRERLLEMCIDRPGNQRAVMEACAEDFLLFVSVFCFIVEPREGEDTAKGMLPFIPWCHQDPVFAACAHYAGKRHIIGDKSRAQGASWMMMALFVWKFIFEPYSLLGMGSKNEEAADLPDNPDSLGWKFDFLMANLPPWMRPPGIRINEPHRKVGSHTWKNVLNNSTLKAYSATAGIGRSGRFTIFGLDESAFFPVGTDMEAVSNLLKTTNGLIMLSTPNGMNNEHYDRIQRPGPWLSVILDWRDNPVQSRGKYTVRNGKLFKYDDFEHPPNYKFILDGRIRSPWYDRKWFEDKENALMIGQELDREYQGSKGRPFPKDALERAKGMVRVPTHTGNLTFESTELENIEDMRFIEGEAYKFDLWVPLYNGQPPVGPYTIGLDISTGTGGDFGSNSVIEVFHSVTREQVAEFAINTMPPEDLAEYAVAVCYWFGHGEATTYMIWEKNGPGVRFSNEILATGYPNIFFQKGGEEVRRYAKRTDKPGYFTSDTQLTLTPLISSLCASDVTIRSSALLEECAQYIFNDSGKVENPRSKTSRDGGSRGISHGDRAIAAAVCIRALNERKRIGLNRITESNTAIVSNSMAGRMMFKRARRKALAMSRMKW